MQKSENMLYDVIHTIYVSNYINFIDFKTFDYFTRARAALRHPRKNFLTNNLRLVKKNLSSEESTGLVTKMKKSNITDYMPHYS